MNKPRALTRLLLISTLVFSKMLEAQTPSLIPLPRQVEWKNGAVPCDHIEVRTPPDDDDQTRFLRDEAARIFPHRSAKPTAKLVFQRGDVPGAPQGNGEAYLLTADGATITVTASHSVGWIYGLQTLRQMLQTADGKLMVPAARIVDYPAFAWRGFMHDLGRNPQDVATLKRFADVMARYKYNVFHLHLTDNPGYRIECRAYPQLNNPQYQDKTRRPGFFYSYAQLKEIIAYCRARGIEVVPEIDMPGHSAYFKRAFGFEMQDPRGVEIMKKVLGEFLDEINTPRFHMGADEVRANPNFVNEIADVIRARGRKLLVWRPGNLPQGDFIVHRWSAGAQNNAPPPGIAQIDSRHNYVNHMDALEAPLRMLALQPCDRAGGDAQALGGTLCHWPDNNVGEEINIYRQSPVLPALLGGAERYWRGGEIVAWKHVAQMPLAGDKFQASYAEFETRLVQHRDVLGSEWPFPYVRNSGIPWKLIGPFENGGDASQVFAPETEIRDSYEIAGKTHHWVDAVGGTIHINHFFDYPGWLPAAKSGTAYAYTQVWSPREQSVGFWIGFNGYSRSGGRRGGPNPDVGQWSNTGSQIWINGAPIAPPTWKNPKLGVASAEIPLDDEDYFYRDSTPVPLKQGWNRILIKAPRNAPAWKWMFTCVPVQIVNGAPREVEGLKFSVDPPA